jgi:FkbM family methyltransferase
MKLFKRLENIFYKTKYKFKRKYRIGSYSIYIPKGYPLPSYQHSFRLYDSFLSVLGRNINSNDIIIDIGANIGDSTFLLLQACKNPIISVEPSNKFYPLLVKNINQLPLEEKLRIKTFQKLIGTGDISGALKHIKGSASLEVNGTISESVSLDDLIHPKNNIALIKVDTDGFDYDVILSARTILEQSEPIIFWENDIYTERQYQGFNELYPFLNQLGYEYFFIFDNFGNLLLETEDITSLHSINDYLYSIESYDCTRTFHYVDILASTNKFRGHIQTAVSQFKEQLIFNKNLIT